MGGCIFLSCKSPCHEGRLRYLVAMLVFFGMIVSYMHRASLNVAIVEMVERKEIEHTCKSGDEDSNIQKIEGGKRKWDQQVQAVLLFSFYTTYVVTHFPGGYISDRWGGRWPMLLAIAISSLTTGLIPVFVQNFHWGFTAFLRVVAGAAQGVILPTMTSLLSRWVPASERALLGGIVYSGGAVGSIVGNLSSGLLIAFFKSWTVVFYFATILGVIWLLAAFFWLHSTPQSHPFILPKEMQFLQDNIKQKEKRPFPLGNILKDTAVWAIIVGQFSHSYTIFTLLTNLPKYMNEVLDFNMKKNALASSLPYMGQYFGTLIAGSISDYVITYKNANITMVRVIYNTFGNMVPCVCLLGAAYAECNQIMALSFFSLALFCKGPFFASLKVNGMDLTHYHAGLLMAISNGIGAIAAIFSPYIIAKVAPQNTHPQWHLVFWIVFSVNAVGSVFYIFFGRGTRSKWDYTPEEWEAFQAIPKKKHPWYLQKTREDHKADLANRVKAKLDEASAELQEAKNVLQDLESDAKKLPPDDEKGKSLAMKKIAKAIKKITKIDKKVQKYKSKHEILVAQSVA